MSEDVSVDPSAGVPPQAGPVPDAPLLAELMPWSVAPLRLGRDWVRAPDAATLRKRWTALTRAEDETARSVLFRPSRARTLHSSVAPLPGLRAPGGRIADEQGGCPAPVRLLYGAYDQQWLIPDSRLIDAARAELWRVTDAAQIHLVETGCPDPGSGDPGVVFTAHLATTGAVRAVRGAQPRIRPLHRRPGGREPNLAPGLLRLLTQRLELPVRAPDLLAWTAAAAQADAATGELTVPLTEDRALWERGVALGQRTLWLHTRGAHGDPEPGAGGSSGTVPRMPGGRRPYVRAPLPADPAPEQLRYDAEEQALYVGEGCVSPVEPAAWDFRTGGVRVLESWCAQRTRVRDEPGSLAALGPTQWPQEWTSELLELITVLTLLAELRPAQRELVRALRRSPTLGAADLRAAGVLPVPPGARRPASVLDPSEEGPEGQLALL